MCPWFDNSRHRPAQSNLTPAAEQIAELAEIDTFIHDVSITNTNGQVRIALGRVNAQITHTSSAITRIAQNG